LPRRSLGEGGLDVGPRVFIFRKSAVPAVGEIKGRYVKHEHGVVLARASAKNSPQSLAETLFFGFHDLLY
jgi:hypothetical protein